MERIFDHFDINKDGKISPAELQQCVRATGREISLEEAEATVAEWSGSQEAGGQGESQELGLEEFTRMVEAGGEEERMSDLEAAFRMYEMDGSGCITPKSLKRMLSRLGEAYKKSLDECKKMIRAYDLDGDGVLSFDEFKVMMATS
ncbi:hypothetical protein Droror1_Dr00014005 [Drosera rotundifolia]